MNAQAGPRSTCRALRSPWIETANRDIAVAVFFAVVGLAGFGLWYRSSFNKKPPRKVDPLRRAGSGGSRAATLSRHASPLADGMKVASARPSERTRAELAPHYVVTRDNKLRRSRAPALSLFNAVEAGAPLEEIRMAIQNSGKDIVKSLAWFVGAIALLFALIHYAPIISHGAF